MEGRNIKLRYKILIVTATIAITAILAVSELFNFMGGPGIRRIKLPHGSTELSIVTDGFQDRTSSVYLNSRLGLSMLLFDFDPYGGGIYSFDVSDGKYLGFLNDYPDHWTQGEDPDDLKAQLRDLFELFGAGESRD